MFTFSGLVVFTEFVSGAQGAVGRRRPVAFYRNKPVKTPFTLNASAHLSALVRRWHIAIAITTRRVAAVKKIYLLFSSDSSRLSLGLCHRLYRLVCSQLVRALVVYKRCCAVVVFTEFVSGAQGAVGRRRPVAFYRNKPVKTPFTLNASAHLSALVRRWHIAIAITTRRVAAVKKIYLLFSSDSSRLSLGLCHRLYRLVYSQLVRALVVS